MIDVELLLDTLEGAGFAPRLASGETEVVMVHDTCGDDTGHLYISTEHGAWICFHCDESGSLSQLFRELLDMGRFDAYMLAGRIIGERRKGGEVVRPPAEITQVEVELPKEFIPSSGVDDMAARYLQSRGLRPSLAPHYGIGYCLHGLYAYRLIIPVWTDGRLITFIARAMFPTMEKKVLMPEHSKASQALFNLSTVTPPLCIVVEGVLDALRLRENAVATLSTVLSDHQVNLLRTHGFRGIILMRDGDEAGRAAARRDADTLMASGFQVYVAQLPEGEDPCSATDRQVAEALDKARQPMVQLGCNQ